MSTLDANLKLQKVTVFQSSCMFKMEGTVKCKKGENEIIIDSLTRKMDKNSVRIKGQGYGRIANIIIEKMFSGDLDKEELKKLMDKRDKLVKTKNEIEDSLKDLQNLKAKKEIAIETFANEFPKYYSLGKIKIEDVNQLDSLFKEQIAELSKNLRKLNEENNETEIKINEVASKINQLGYSTNREVNAYFRILIILDAEKESDFLLELSFTVSDASWQPFYDIIIDENHKVQINLMGNIFNRTGVDWNEVDLEISTASVTPVKMDKPTPYNINHYIPIKYSPAKPMRIRRRPAAPVVAVDMDFIAQRSISADEFGGFDDLPEAEPAPPPELNIVESTVSSNFGVQVYTLNTKFTVKSDKNPKPIPLFKQELPSIKQYFWSTSSPDRVLCNNKIKNKDRLILPGSAKVYVGDEFIGETSLDLIGPNEEFKLGERITYDVKVKKEMKVKNKSKEGAFKGKTSINYRFTIEISNLKNVTEDLIIYDRIPHSVSEKIKVKLLDFSIEPDSNVMNVLKFVLNMEEVKEKRVITYNYEITHEKDLDIRPNLP